MIVSSMAGPVSRGARAPTLGAVLGERYKLRRFLGSGAMAAVYEASDPQGKRVAVKVLLALLASDHAAELAARFAREARVASAIDSEHVVPVVDAGVDASLGLPFVVMPLLSGVDL